MLHLNNNLMILGSGKYLPEKILTNKEIEDTEGTIRRVHNRVDRIETKIKTVQGMGTAVATALGAAAAWLGLSKT